jgi:nitrite reductase (NADH) small subunit
MTEDSSGAAWHRVCESDAVPHGMRTFEVGHRKIVLARVDASLFAFDRFCPHVAGPMERGELNGTLLTCPLHGWRFDLARGGCEIHGERPLGTFGVKEEGGAIYVWLTAIA